jgi:hypothetical protein
MPLYRRRCPVPATPEQLMAYHLASGAFERLTPPFERVKVRRWEPVALGARQGFEVRFGPIPLRWEGEITAFTPPDGFVDEQRGGPFRSWRHEHRFLDRRVEDRITYQLPLGPLGDLVAGRAIASRLEQLFQWRQARTRLDLERLVPFEGRPRLVVAITGATGLVGTALSSFLRVGGHQVRRVVRRPSAPGDIGWDPARGVLEASALEGVDAVVHLAGEPVAARWTASRKQAIRESRVQGTSLLAGALARLKRPPRVLISGSAVGYYGTDSRPVRTEEDPPGTGFLAEVAQAWEAATAPAEAAGVRVVHLRTGVVLALEGGALPAQLPLFRLGMGGPLGHGRQGISWIVLDDLVYAIHHLLWAEDVRGPVNGVAPMPVSQRDFARSLGRALGRPAFLPAPSAAVRLLMGEMADELVLGGQKVLPRRLQRSGFRFVCAELSTALAWILGAPPS